MAIHQTERTFDQISSIVFIPRRNYCEYTSRRYSTCQFRPPLVAHGCLPNIDFPLCADHQARLPREIVKMEEEDKLIRSKPHEDQRPMIDRMREEQMYFLKDLPESEMILLIEKSHSLKIIDEPTSYVNHKPEIDIIEPTEDHKSKINITELTVDYKPSVFFDLTSNFEKSNKLCDPSDVDVLLNTLINGRNIE